MPNQNLFPPQQDVIEQGLLEKETHCLLNMATGSGKTFLAEIAIEKCLQRGFRAVYLTPLKALADEKYTSWLQRFKGYTVGLFTGDINLSNKSKKHRNYLDSQIYIMTPERLDACLRNWRTHWSWIPEIDLVVIDEFHLLGDKNRGPRLEGSITRLMRLNPFARILGLSATLANVKELADWLQGLHYVSKWRQIPLKKKTVRFSNPKDKFPLLIEEVTSCLDRGGKSLIFANSRSRAQTLAQSFKDIGLKAKHHHAGLNRDERKETEDAFRFGDTQVLVATSTLEMGLNLPARQVIVYDSYAFDGIGFTDLPVWSYMQRAGRAGRPGLDTEGEVVLFLPKWIGSIDKYINEECEPINSSLSISKAMAEQILVELFGGYSRTREDLIEGFLPLTLYYHQNPNANINKDINTLFLADMITIEKEEEDNSLKQQDILKPTKLGRLAVKLMFTPSSVKLIKEHYVKIDQFYYFDLLLLAALTEDCNPILRANYEDLDPLMEIVLSTPSCLLDYSLEKLKKLSDEYPSTLRILAAIKMAAICHSLVNNNSKTELALLFDIYEADIDMLKNNVVRLLDGMSAIFNALDPSDEDTEESSDDTLEISSSQLCKRLSSMLYYEIDSEGVYLTEIDGIGGKLAKELIGHGYSTISIVAQSRSEDLAKIPRIGTKLAKKINVSAQALLATEQDFEYIEQRLSPVVTQVKLHTANICPYRLRRSMELRLRGHDGNMYYVTGGSEDHRVVSGANGFICDCKDYEQGQSHCKHVLTVKRFIGDKLICNMLKNITEDKKHSLRDTLPSLWFSVPKPDQASKEVTYG
ncbi:DEAD/DEAH box helicase [Desulfosporosinus fructosivorans]|uniref:DEAD/DEAH box helicase n=1 Tax=Desulfosporosinus fructosivorans TaxID=2018669 RepID=A0A4Z0R5B4_9FIRM|nr:DEAD/DEAH box helicase [Desulfosporosinus fructosivorans]TGE37197.1 DEAD/DEAH box helicase [Desulfosporosinus fructosivorans]